jgi:aminoglycoside 6'-N-acetyltransferase
VLTLRPMDADDVAFVTQWLREPHVAEWYLAGSNAEQEEADLRRSVAGAEAVHVLLVLRDGRPIGWCQWYRCDVSPDWATEVGAGPGDVGVDYAIGDPTCVGRGLGTALVGTLVSRVRAEHPGVALVSDPDARNRASRRVLEKNGFRLVGVRALVAERTDDPMAIYRLEPAGDATMPGPTPAGPGGPGSS